MLSFIFTLLTVGVVLIASQDSTSCPDYDASKIKLVTLDCFAALMAWEGTNLNFIFILVKIDFILFVFKLVDSMKVSVASVLPDLSTSQVDSLVLAWEGAYGSMQNRVYAEEESGAFPFSWDISKALSDILIDMNLSVSRADFHRLIACWGQLTPWEGTQEALEVLVKGNITIGALSNGDRYTLTNVVSVFQTPVVFSHIFPSDFPVGAQKPQKAIYQQVLDVTDYDISEVLHVAGGATDGSGARDAGFFSALLHKDPVPDKTPPCFVLNDISELPAVLGL